MSYARQFNAVAVPSAEVIRRRLRRRRIRLAAVTGSVAGILAIGAAAATAALPAWRLARPADTASRLGWLPAGPELPADARPEAAPYLVTLGLGHRRGLRLAVHNWRTGAFLGQVRPPARRCFQQVLGASDDRTFLLTAQGCRLYIRTWFYELRLTRSGHPQPLIPVGLPLSLRYDSTFTLSPDGKHLAYAAFANVRRPNRSTITVYDLISGAKRTWSGPGLVTTIAWAGDHSLDFSLAWNARTKPRFRPAVRLLDTTAAGSSLLASRLLPAFTDVYPAGTFNDPLPAAHGVIYGITGIIVEPNLWDEVARYSALKARPTEVFRPWLLIGHNYSWCDPLWTDGSGLHALAVCGTPNHGLRIDGHRMRLVNLHFPVQEMTPSTNAYFFAF